MIVQSASEGITGQVLLKGSSAVLMQKVFMENCRDEDSHSEPINKILQPNSYSTALSKLSSHSNPVKTEQFLRDLGLNTPELFQSLTSWIPVGWMEIASLPHWHSNTHSLVGLHWSLDQSSSNTSWRLAWSMSTQLPASPSVWLYMARGKGSSNLLVSSKHLWHLTGSWVCGLGS